MYMDGLRQTTTKFQHSFSFFFSVVCVITTQPTPLFNSCEAYPCKSSTLPGDTWRQIQNPNSPASFWKFFHFTGQGEHTSRPKEMGAHTHPPTQTQGKERKKKNNTQTSTHKPPIGDKVKTHSVLQLPTTPTSAQQRLRLRDLLNKK